MNYFAIFRLSLAAETWLRILLPYSHRIHYEIPQSQWARYPSIRDFDVVRKNPDAFCNWINWQALDAHDDCGGRLRGLVG